MATTYDDGALEIVPTRTRYLMLTVVSLVLAVLSGLVLVSGYTPLLAIPLLAFGVPFFLVCGLYYVRKFVSPGTTLRIDEMGIEDASSLTAVGFVAWNEMDEVAFETVGGQTLLRVRVTDMDAILQDVSWTRRTLISLNASFMNEPSALYVAFDNVGASADDIAASIRRHSRFDPQRSD